MKTAENLEVLLYNREYDDFSVSSDVSFTVNRYSFSAIGGPKEAVITMYGSAMSLWNMVDRLRSEVRFVNRAGDFIWWGYLASVEIRTGNLVFGTSLDETYNKIRVAYTTFGDRKTTDWAEDTMSVNTYGTKELMDTISDATDEEADNRRNSLLEEKKIPVPLINFQSQAEGGFSALLTCRGWYETLDWTYYSQTKGLEAHVGTGVGIQSLGVVLDSACLVFGGKTITSWNEDLASFKKGDIVGVSNTVSNDGYYTVSQGSTSGCSFNVEEDLVSETDATATLHNGSKMAQEFAQTSGSDWDASRIHVRAQTTGSPTDFLMAGIHAVNSGSPNSTPLASGSIAASKINTTVSWVEIPLSSSVTLVSGTTYYVHLQRSSSAATAPSDSYRVDIDEGLGYPTGSMYMHVPNAGWIERGTDADMLFKVIGTRSVSEQIKQAVEAEGQFLSDVYTFHVSTVETPEYRDGETTTLTEINELLKAGTANSKRLVVSVDYQKNVIIDEEPTTEYEYTLDGSFKDQYGMSIPNHKCPVGVWCRISEFIPHNFGNALAIANPNNFFIEESEYYVNIDKVVPRSRDTSSAWDIGMVKSG